MLLIDESGEGAGTSQAMAVGSLDKQQDEAHWLHSSSSLPHPLSHFPP